MWSSIVRPDVDGRDTKGQVWVVFSTFVKLFGSVTAALVMVGLTSVIFGTMSYYTAVWNLAKIKGRCKGSGGNEDCQKDLITFGMAVDDTNSPHGQGLSWDPITKGTMGWLVADVLLSTLFL